MRFGLKQGILNLFLALLGVAVLSSTAFPDGFSIQCPDDDLNRLYRVQYGDGTTIEYSYDNGGNRTAKQVVDTTPPATAPMPPGGQYYGPLTASLTCSDGS